VCVCVCVCVYFCHYFCCDSSKTLHYSILISGRIISAASSVRMWLIAADVSRIMLVGVEFNSPTGHNIGHFVLSSQPVT